MKKLVATLTSIFILSSSFIYADNCYLNIEGHGKGKVHKLEMYSENFQELKNSLEDRGYKVKFKGKTKNSNYVYHIYVDSDNKVDEIICLKCKGKIPPEIDIPEEEIPEVPEIDIPEEEIPEVPEEELG